MREELAALRIEHRDAPRRRRWPWFLLVVVALAVVAAFAWMRFGERAPRVAAETAREETAARRATVLNASGYVTARRRATVASEVTGRLVEVTVEEGDPVSAGQILARIDDAQQRAALELAEANLAAARKAVAETESRIELAELTLSRARQLLTEEVISQAELDEAETTLEALEARAALERQQAEVAARQVTLREVDLEDTLIRAPFDGVVVSKDAQEGEMVSPVSAGGGFTRTGIYSLVDMTSLEIEVDVNEAYISRVRADQPVEAVLDAYPDWRIAAHVITTIPTADRQKATVQVRIGFDALDPRILPDMGVKVSFQDGGADEIADAEAQRPRVTVSADAVRSVAGNDVLWVLQNGRVERRAVRVGGESNGRVEIVAGLSAGERVVTNAPADLADGDRVVTE